MDEIAKLLNFKDKFEVYNYSRNYIIHLMSDPEGNS